MIGYARVSTTDQHLNLQRDALKAAGCKKIFADRGMSGSAATRPQLTRALKALRPGDTLVVWKLDRLGRSLSHLVETIADLGKRGVNFRSLSDPIDTESAGGRFVLHIMAALSEFERSLIIERTRAGLVLRSRSIRNDQAAEPQVVAFLGGRKVAPPERFRALRYRPRPGQEHRSRIFNELLYQSVIMITDERRPVS